MHPGVPQTTGPKKDLLDRSFWGVVDLVSFPRFLTFPCKHPRPSPFCRAFPERPPRIESLAQAASIQLKPDASLSNPPPIVFAALGSVAIPYLIYLTHFLFLSQIATP
nr:hypothetical protein Iba_scaffold851012CG0010 [Ipomoea batatas]GMD80910.1 hypothetical protein Iba_chr13eCG6460 [Ipomoea batatas]GME09962.1 hypothetical protein Iba_scaffold9240CG0030 [Ipomoea batatas]GME14354.1 hypothetical protein Iba_scaffold15170CG0070 [Ipomoea batatas]